MFVWMSIVLYIGLSFVSAPPIAPNAPSIAPLTHPMHLLEMPILRCFWKCLKSYRLVMHPTAPSPSFLCTPDAPNLIADRQSESACIYGSRKIDLIITKSVSRFARNTVDSLKYIRLLKEINIPVFFEKESINTMDAKGEVLITIMASLAQQESESLSKNTKMGIQYRFQQGKVLVNARNFLGYDKDEEGHLIINPTEAEIVKRIFREYLEGASCMKIARGLERDGILTARGNPRWHDSTVRKILENEKYMGDALLQKTYTIDFLNKKRGKNNGTLPQS